MHHDHYSNRNTSPSYNQNLHPNRPGMNQYGYDQKTAAKLSITNIEDGNFIAQVHPDITPIKNYKHAMQGGRAAGQSQLSPQQR